MTLTGGNLYCVPTKDGLGTPPHSTSEPASPTGHRTSDDWQIGYPCTGIPTLVAILYIGLPLKQSSMEIDVNQKKISIGDKYSIFVDGQETYLASRQLFQLLPEVNLFKLGEERARMTINKRLSWFKAKYDITRWDNNVLQFRTKSIWKLQYECQVGHDRYTIYGHR